MTRTSSSFQWSHPSAAGTPPPLNMAFFNRTLEATVPILYSSQENNNVNVCSKKRALFCVNRSDKRRNTLDTLSISSWMLLYFMNSKSFLQAEG